MVKSEKIYLAFDPERELHLGSAGGSEFGFIMLENISNVTVAFKIRTDNETFVSAAPSKGVIGPYEYTEVRVTVSNDILHKAPIRLQVIAAPLDEKFHVDRIIPDLFKRSSKRDIQDQRYTVYHGIGLNPPPHPLLPSKKLSLTTEELIGMRPTEPAPILQEVVKEETAASAVLDNNQPLARSSANSSVSWHPSRLKYRSRYYPAMVAHKGEDQSRSSSVASVPPNRTILEGGKAVPQYSLHLSPTEAELSESRFPLGKRLLKKFSRIGALIAELTEQSKVLRSSQRWSMAFFWMVLTLLILLVYFLVAVPVWIHRRRHRTVTTAVLPSHFDVSDLGDTFIEDRTDMTLDEFIHSKMN